MTKKWTFQRALTTNGWTDDLTLFTDDGLIIEPSEDYDESETVKGIALPPFQNAHSHAFQYAMAGLAENPGANANDSFWTWRNSMYSIAQSVGPDELEDIAALLYHEMLRNGYSSVAEFQYLHKDPSGKLYEDIGEMSLRLISAAKRVGIAMTLVPILYQNGGFNSPPAGSQNRFTLTREEYSNLLSRVEKEIDIKVAIGFHSLRAVDIETIASICSADKWEAIHIHIAEQLKEVNDCISATGLRPLHFLNEHVNLDKRWNLVHATHLDSREIDILLQSSANVVLCPSTEGNLGDGVFPIREYNARKGRWCIGTDSHIGLNPFEELRLLDYGSRLVTHKRISFSDTSYEDLALALYNNGKAAMNQTSGFLTQGTMLETMVIDSSHPLLETDHLISTLIYHFDPSVVLGMIVNGEWMLKDKRHPEKDAIYQGFTNAMRKLKLR